MRPGPGQGLAPLGRVLHSGRPVPKSPLLSHPSPDSPVAWRGGAAISRNAFLAHARQLAERMPPGRHYLAHCADRYRFAVTLAAGLMTGRTALLPSTFNASVAEQLRAFSGDVFVVTDDPGVDSELPLLRFSEDVPAPDEDLPVPDIPHEHAVAWVFTSGSTGAPVPHCKTWGKLVLNVQTECGELGLGRDTPFAVLATVPPQHMYGFETTVLMPLLCGGLLVAERPFFPADICDRLAALPHPRVLVTTPFHLRTLLEADIAVPAADLLVSATAPLDSALAARSEQAFACRLLEIYGSTETSQLASRRTLDGPAWTLFPGIRLVQRDGACWASGGHVEQEMPLGDIIELDDPRHFRLCGRNGDLVNVAGKRSSLGYLNAQLLAIDGVRDGAFFLPPDEDDIGRPAALVVAPGMSVQEVLAALRQRIDPVFLPRPVIQLDMLPRNATGKLPREVCQTLLARHRGQSPA
ncbi:MAG: acyl-CoA synthetase [Rhodocyclaceae bacterium]|nr:acyl-CoA synthetase [Rhodocyclaceae bacterium]